MKTLKCDNCGAGILTDSGDVNVKCDYCGSFVRVRENKDLGLLAVTEILTEIGKLGKHVRDDDFDSRYTYIESLIKRNQFIHANHELNEILKTDETQARAWYYKSLLPILEQQTVYYGNCYINIQIVSRLVKRSHIREYLSSCGLPWYKHGAFMSFYASSKFLYNQKIKFIDKAIECATTTERKQFFKEHKEGIIKRSKSRRVFRFFAGFFLIAILVLTMIGAYMLFRYVLVHNILHD